VRIPLAVPTEAGVAGDFARQLVRILGPAHNAPDGSLNAADFLALGGALADARATTLAALDEAFADSATQLLSELEAMYGLPVRPDLAVATRRTRLVAKVRAARAGAPNEVLRAVHALDPTATISENTPSDVPQEPDQATPPRAGAARLVFLWALWISDAAFDDAETRAAIGAICTQMQPAHTDHSLHTNDPALGFRFGVDAFGRGAFFTV
jgi:uncharacterized protein YmfQ (DUF2313 family)